MKKSMKGLLMVLLCFGILIVIAVSVFNPKAVDLKLLENVNHITVLYGGETFELNEAKSKGVFSYF